MTRFFLTTACIFFIQILNAQPCNFPFSPANTCQEAPLICSLDGYCASNTGAVNSGTPDAFCGVVENNNWVSFIAGSTTFELQITVNNCQQNSGLQAQFFSTSNCNTFTAVSNCLNPVFGTASLVCDNLTIGEVYYLMMDGKNGDVCEYQYELLDGIILSPADVFVDPVNVICNDGTVTINSTAVSPNSNLTYEWTTTNGNILTSSSQSSIEVDAPGIYNISISDDIGCSSSTSVEVIQSPDHLINIGNPDILNCVSNITETLSVFVDPPNGQVYDFNWMTTDGNILSGALTNAPVVDQPGWYYLTVTNNWGCEKMDSVEVFADVNTPVADAGEGGELNCLVPSLELGAQLSSLGNDFSYQWNTNDGNIVSGATTIMPVVDAPGIYQIIVTNNINGCTEADEVTVTLNDREPTGADIQIKNPCFGELNGSILVASVEGGTPPYEYSFDGGNFGANNGKDFLEPGDYDIIIQDDTGCEWETVVSIIQQPELLVDLGDDQHVALGCEIDLQAITNYPIVQIDTVIWSPAVDCASPCLDTTIIPLNNVTYSAEIIDVNGCQGKDTVTYWVRKDRHIYIPNAFSPNDDGINDNFVVYGGKDVAEIKVFRVFDRWGELVMEHKNFQPNSDLYSWDGTLDRKRLNENVFIYYVEVLFLDGWVEKYRGDVLLQR